MPSASASLPLTTEDHESLNLINNNWEEVTAARALEWVRCRENPLYFILNYVYLPEIGGSQRSLKYSEELLHPKFRRVVRCLYRYHNVILMASRQLGKSTIAACMIAWAMNFFPNNRVAVMNMQKRYAQENLNRIKFILSALPKWMRIKPTSRSEIKEYLTLANGSRCDTYYPSASTPPENIARSLTIPIIYIDEAAFIRHIDTIYAAAQPTISKAREQAEKNRYPHFIFITSTPAGTEGPGRFFYEMWSNAVDSDLLFEPWEEGAERWLSDKELLKSYLSDPEKNSFIRVRYHWSEDPTKDLAWYERQRRELNHNRRRISQELDLVFVGGTDCIFEEEVLEQLDPCKPQGTVDLGHGARLTIFETDLPTDDLYLMGVDTGSSLKGSENAIEIFAFRDFRQVAEYHGRLGSLTKYGEVVVAAFHWLRGKVGDRIVLAVERNSIGQAVIENLLYREDFDFVPFLYREKGEFGINTNVKTKELMVASFAEYLRDNPKGLRSGDLLSQLYGIERASLGTIRSKGSADLFMAACFCAYVRKVQFMELSRMVDFSPEKHEEEILDRVRQTVRGMSSVVRDEPEERVIEEEKPSFFLMF